MCLRYEDLGPKNFSCLYRHEGMITGPFILLREGRGCFIGAVPCQKGASPLRPIPLQPPEDCEDGMFVSWNLEKTKFFSQVEGVWGTPEEVLGRRMVFTGRYLSCVGYLSWGELLLKYAYLSGDSLVSFGGCGPSRTFGQWNSATSSPILGVFMTKGFIYLFWNYVIILC